MILQRQKLFNKAALLRKRSLNLNILPISNKAKFYKKSLETARRSPEEIKAIAMKTAWNSTAPAGKKVVTATQAASSRAADAVAVGKPRIGIQSVEGNAFAVRGKAIPVQSAPNLASVAQAQQEARVLREVNRNSTRAIRKGTQTVVDKERSVIQGLRVNDPRAINNLPRRVRSAMLGKGKVAQVGTEIPLERITAAGKVFSENNN